MSISRLNSAPVPVRRPVGRPAIAQAAHQAPAAKPQARAVAASAEQKFSDLASYERFVESSPVMGLPDARSRVAKADARIKAAAQALEARQKALGQPALAAAVASAKKDLEATTYPYRPKAAELRAQAGDVSKQIANVSKAIMVLQQQIAHAEGNKAARNRGFWRDDNYDGWDAVGDLLGSIGDNSTIKQAQAKINELTNQKVALEQKMLELTVQATALDDKKGDPDAIAKSQAVVNDAESALAKVEAQLENEKREVAQAGAELSEAQAKQKELDTLKAGLKDYGAHFGFFTRAKWFFSNHGWKKALDNYWQAKGL
jgi:chromosome segregation ATPase